jgi:ABC-type branched-subunit amino acid transport system permease subunit
MPMLADVLAGLGLGVPEALTVGPAVADAWQMILGSVLLLVILFAPGGLWGMAARAIGARGR